MIGYLHFKEALSRWKERNPYLLYLWLNTVYSLRRRRYARMSDIECINKIYSSYCGHCPNLNSPQRFSEKMQWLKLNYRDELMPVLANKYAVRSYLSNNGYGSILNDIIAVFETPEEIELNKLPESFVLKASHSSGWNLVVKDKSKIHWGIWKRIMQFWLLHSIEWDGREWHYGKIKPRIICERHIEDNSGGLMDYKFYCFNGEPKIVQLNINRGLSTATQNFYDLNWNLLPFGKTIPHNPNIHTEKPTHFDEMVKYARELSKPFPYVRMDFYEANGRVYFGEFTFFPCSGMPDFTPSEWDVKLGEMLSLPDPQKSIYI